MTRRSVLLSYETEALLAASYLTNHDAALAQILEMRKGRQARGMRQGRV